MNSNDDLTDKSHKLVRQLHWKCDEQYTDCETSILRISAGSSAGGGAEAAWEACVGGEAWRGREPVDVGAVPWRWMRRRPGELEERCVGVGSGVAALAGRGRRDGIKRARQAPPSQQAATVGPIVQVSARRRAGAALAPHRLQRRKDDATPTGLQ
ncbi:Protein of unknown function [Gryllus bimaculatus]|nr:Protein of unknown function [Gryllus bimaculatus]